TDSNYGGSVNGSLTITKASASVSLGNLSRTYDGLPKAVSVSTTPAGISTIVTYEGSPTAPTAAGSYSVIATVSDSNYIGTANGTLTIDTAAATVTFGNLTSTYDGSPKSASTTTTPTGLSVVITYNGNTIVPTNAGAYAVVATIADPNHAGTTAATFTIDKADQAITFPTLTDKNVTDAPFAVAATTTSGLIVGFSASGSCTVAGA